MTFSLRRIVTVVTLMALALLGSARLGYTTGHAAAAEEQAARLFELRTYVAPDGKFEDLQNRFRNHTNKLFVKHGMQLIGYWTPASGPESKNTLIYILAYPDKAARDKSWAGFVADPDWQAAFKESQKNGTLTSKVESVLMSPTDYSPIR